MRGAFVHRARGDCGNPCAGEPGNLLRRGARRDMQLGGHQNLQRHFAISLFPQRMASWPDREDV